MKYRGIASPPAIKSIFLHAAVLPLLFFVPVCIGLLSHALAWEGALLCLLIPFAWIATGMSIAYANAYVRFEMDENGIGNRHIFFKWEEIERLELITVNLTPKWQRRPWWHSELDSLICLGNPVSGEMGKQNKKKAVFLTISQRNLLRLKECNNGKSARVDEFIELYLKT